MSYEQFLMSLCLWREARGQSVQALQAIKSVILNRAADAKNRWPKTVAGVILQRSQFSSFSAGDPNSVLFPIPTHNGNSNTPDWNAWSDCLVVTMSKDPDSTDGANHYESMPVDRLPDWADSSKITKAIGSFRFYRL